MTARLTTNIVERAVLFSENIMMRESMYKNYNSTVGRHFFDHSRYADRKGSTGFNSI